MAHEFLFAVSLADPGRFDDMLNEVAASVLRHAGCAATSVTQVIEEIHAIVTGSGSGTAFDVQFRAHAGSIEVVVSTRDREIWRTSRRLP